MRECVLALLRGVCCEVCVGEMGRTHGSLHQAEVKVGGQECKMKRKSFECGSHHFTGFRSHRMCHL